MHLYFGLNHKRPNRRACNIRVHRKGCVCEKPGQLLAPSLGSCSWHSWKSINTLVKRSSREILFLNTFLFNVFTSFNLLRRSEVLQACLFNDHGQEISSVVVFSSFSLNIQAWSCGPPRVLDADLGLSGGLCTRLRKVELAGPRENAQPRAALNPFLRFYFRVESRRLFNSILQYSCYYN